ncbi:glycosyltransferase family A protein [Polaribacter sp. 20A6]|uniref:glycosyltransferase family 2 protein n=1 Tax=Polaribacter sp. 20A6 TaxID=2687289 RepID=UPI0013FD5FAA|nr:glycosyltransferase family A protein [Polaribacter sp. 20A6]
MDKTLKEQLPVSVVMPVYNCEDYIKEAVISILNQTFTNFEFIIVDDCSSDRSFEYLESFKDERIKLYRNSHNLGISKTLNFAIKHSKGKYIARMDSDDISLPTRLEEQFNFLKSNQDYILCGASFKIIGQQEEVCFPENHEAIKLGLLNRNCILHPSVMIKKSVLLELETIYNFNMEPAEDYDLWVRLINKGRYYNLNKILVHYRVHEQQITKKNEVKRIDKAFEVRLRLLQNLNCNLSEQEKKVLKHILIKTKSINFKEIKSFTQLKKKILLANSHSFFEKSIFTEYLNSLEAKEFRNYFLRRKQYSLKVLFQFFNVYKVGKNHINFTDQLKILTKSFIFFKKAS